MKSETNVLAYKSALEAARAGISVVPPSEDGAKKPGGEWKKYQSEAADLAQLARWYEEDCCQGVGWVCGAISGGLEVLDFDDQAIWSEYKHAAEQSGIGELLDRVANGYFERSPNGAHLAYRCGAFEGNKKLAKKKGAKARIETRGEGGYIIVAPSGRAVNRAGDYVLVSGGPESIQNISEEERASLHRLAETFGDYEPEDREKDYTEYNGEDRPGDLFNQRASWGDILGPHGWRLVYKRGLTDHWCRPGKKHGISATTNHNGSDLLYVFSSSTDFEPERGYSKFSAWSLLEHGGDFSAAASEAALLYGYDDSGAHVDVDAILENHVKRKSKPDKDKFPLELLDVPGAVGWLGRWITETAGYKQPILALGAACAGVAGIVARKIKGPTGLHPNLYVLGVGESGSGKDHARKRLIELYSAIDHSGLGQELSSDTALLKCLQRSPDYLLLWDEIGAALKYLFDERKSQSYHVNLVRTLLSLYSSSGDVFRKSYADQDHDLVLHAPSLSIYGTTVPHSLYRSLSSEQLHDGFLSRMLVFRSETPLPDWTDPAPNKIPSGLVGWASRWTAAVNAEGNLVDGATYSPWSIEYSSSARNRLNDARDYVVNYRRELAQKQQPHGIWSRLPAHAEKLALLRAAGRAEPGQVSVTEDDILWGLRVAGYLTERLMEDCGHSVVDNEDERLVSCVIDAIEARGGTITRSQLSRSCRLSAKQLSSTLATLAERDLVSVSKTGTGAGRPRQTVTLRQRFS